MVLQKTGQVTNRSTPSSACCPASPRQAAVRMHANRWMAGLVFVGLGLWGHTPAAQADELQAQEIRAWEFQRTEDRNADQWPDGWRRRTGREYPSYIPIRIVPRDSDAADAARESQYTITRWMMAYRQGRLPQDVVPERTPEAVSEFMDRWVVDKCLEFEMNGGAAELESPLIELDSRYTYSIDASMASHKLNGHRAWVQVNFINDSGDVLGQLKTTAITGEQDWKTYITGEFNHESLKHAQVVVHVEPLTPRAIAGTVRIDGIRIYRMPKIELRMDLPYHVGEPNQPIEVTCGVLGIKNADSSVNFKLLDVQGRELARTTSQLQPLPDVPKAKPNKRGSPASDGKGVNYVSTGRGSSRREEAGASQAGNASKSYATSNPPTKATPLGKPTSSTVATAESSRTAGVAKWSLRVAEPGFYRIAVDLGRTSHRRQSREVTLAITPPGPVGTGGPFGWSLPDFSDTFTPEDVPGLINVGGVGWVKLPVWFDANDVKFAESLAILLERLDHRKVNCVGRLEYPPSKDKEKITNPPPVASVFSNPEIWEPQLEAVLTRMSMKVSWFQLGQDRDLSFIGNSKLIPLLTDIRNRMQAYSQELQLAIPWDWQDGLPQEKVLPWKASQMGAQPPLTAQELLSYIPAVQQAGHMPWVTLNPLPASRYKLLDRCRDLTERMIAVKRTGAQAAFVTTPLDAETGIFNADGTAGEMLLPWRVLNRHLAASEYVGSITMPGGSTNHFFSSGTEGVMVIWNDRETTEQLYLGENVSGVDLWGRPAPVTNTLSDRRTREQKIWVGPLPIVLTGVSVPVARWRMQMRATMPDFGKNWGNKAELKLALENTFTSNVMGTITVNSPGLLQSGQNTQRIQLGESERKEVDVGLTLRSDASAGKHPLRFDFTLQGDQEVSFSSYDSISLGISDVEILWDAIIDSRGELTLHMELNNKTTQPLSFECRLSAPDQPYRPFKVSGALPGHTVRDMNLPMGNMQPGAVLQIKCNESSTGRSLNYIVPVRRAQN